MSFGLDGPRTPTQHLKNMAFLLVVARARHETLSSGGDVGETLQFVL